MGNTIKVAPNVNTMYIAVATSAAGCSDTGFVSVNINQFNIQLTTPGSQVISGSTVQLQTFSPSSYEVLSWTPSVLFSNQKAKTQTITIDSSINIMVVGQSPQGCKDSAIVSIIASSLDDIYIPSAFTPNGDGKNDLFRVLGGNIQSLEMKIFNRWGELIFSTQERAKGWDGTFAGKEQPGAVYVYVLSATLRNGKKVSKKGTVTLLR
jgi:gliding motility-associated-like protein